MLLFCPAYTNTPKSRKCQYPQKLHETEEPTQFTKQRETNPPVELKIVLRLKCNNKQILNTWSWNNTHKNREIPTPVSAIPHTMNIETRFSIFLC